MMCETAGCTLTLDALLTDPLVHLVMRSDNVSETDHSALLIRVQEALIARTAVMQGASQPAH
jgi:hypothetical protein